MVKAVVIVCDEGHSVEAVAVGVEAAVIMAFYKRR